MAWNLDGSHRYSARVSLGDGTDTSNRTVSGINFAGEGVTGPSLTGIGNFIQRLYSVSTLTMGQVRFIDEQTLTYSS